MYRILIFSFMSLFFFFFQAEDGIRDPLVTGVQTCALPIYSPGAKAYVAPAAFSLDFTASRRIMVAVRLLLVCTYRCTGSPWRSEERRVGKECRARWAA